MRVRTQRVPVGYREVEYLESTGTQYIDSGVKPTQNTKVKAKLFTKYVENKNWFGGSAITGEGYVFNAWQNSRIEYMFCNTNWASATTPVPVINNVFEVDFSKNGIYINGTSLGITMPSTSFTSSLSLTLFVRKTGSGYIKGRFYYCTIYDNTTPVRNLIPCERMSDNKPGMYDTVNNVFYTNSGTGEFIKGPYKDSYKLSLLRIPPTYQEVEYIESDGNQLIKIGSSDAKKYYVKQSFNQLGSGRYTLQGYSTTWYGTNDSSNYFQYADGNVTVNTTTQLNTNTIYEITLDANGIKLNDTFFAYDQTQSKDWTKFGLFQIEGYPQFKFRGKIYNAKVFNEDNKVIKNLIPCYRKSDNVIGLYDLVEGKFYTNQGSGTFTKGNDVKNIGMFTPKILIAEGTTNLGGTSKDYSNMNKGVEMSCNSWGGDAGTVTYYADGGYNNYPYKVYHKTATGSGGIYSKTANDIIIEAGKTYTVSVYIKASRAFSDSNYSFNINRGSDNRYITFGQNVVFTTEWKRISFTFTATSAQAGNYGEMSIIYNDTVTDYYVYYSGFQVEQKDHVTPYTPSTRPDNTII